MELTDYISKGSLLRKKLRTLNQIRNSPRTETKIRSQVGDCFGIESMGNAWALDKLPIFGMGNSSLLPNLCPNPLPLLGLVCVHPELNPYPNGAESLLALDPFLDTPIPPGTIPVILSSPFPIEFPVL